MRVKAFIVNAFVDNGEGGNPAGVVLDADALTPEQKQSIAAQIGVSETAFVSHSRTAAFKLDFFTPTRQIPHCGHATIATFSLLKQLGNVQEGSTSKETIDGNRDIFIIGRMAFMEQRKPQYTELSPEIFSEILLSLKIHKEILSSDAKPCIVNTGNSFLILPLRDSPTVKLLSPDFDAIARISETLGLIGYYAFSRFPEEQGRAAGTRMFAPLYGINEEAATGMAAGPLACFLYDRLNVDSTEMLIEQGRWMTPPSPSVLTAKLDTHDGKIQKCIVGGEAKLMNEILLTV